MNSPPFSVIVASYNSPATLEKCLQALAAQLPAEAEVLVADCSDEDPRIYFRQMIPGVRFLRFEQRLTIPELRREALKIATGKIILLTEGRLVPSHHWAASLVEAHKTHPQAPAVGGPIDHSPASPFDSAVFFCEYGQHMPPVPEGECDELSGGNVSYKRWALDLSQDLSAAAAWEPFLHRRLEQKGRRLRRASTAVVTYVNSLTAKQFLQQRFHYGRWFAAARVEDGGPLRRLASTAFCPLLPLLLTWRLGRIAGKRGRLGSFLGALLWILFFQTVWSMGEFCGYLAGRGRSDRQVF